jgi:hypothetical protein
MAFSFKAKVVCMRFDGDEPNIELHDKATSGKRNVPVLLPNGQPAVKPDGSPDVKLEEYKHVYLQRDGHSFFHFECPKAEAANFKIGDEVPVTIG